MKRWRAPDFTELVVLTGSIAVVSILLFIIFGALFLPTDNY